MEFINDEKQLNEIIKGMSLNINVDEHKYLVDELYKHIDYTRKKSFRNGYEQGQFDKEMDILYKDNQQNETNDNAQYIKVTVPQPGCPSGRVLYVAHIQENGTVTGLNSKNDNDWTNYYICKGNYIFTDKYGNEI